MILWDFKTFLSCKSLVVFNQDSFQLKKSLVVFNQDSLSFKKSFVVFNQDSSSLKKCPVVFKIIQISKDCLINRILMDFVGFSSEILA